MIKIYIAINHFVKNKMDILKLYINVSFFLDKLKRKVNRIN